MGKIESHYGQTGIAERVIAALRRVHGQDAKVTPDALAPMDHFHNGGVQASAELLKQLALKPSDAVLDIGCGVGGPARWIAAKSGCRVTGIDLTPEFCDAARALNAACGLADRVTIVEGSALAMPLGDAVFERAYSQNVAMNIEDKRALYREAWRVLKPGGKLVLHQLGAGPKGPPHYPAPWAIDESTSFLATLAETERDLRETGFHLERIADVSQATFAAAVAFRQKIKIEGPPPLSIETLVGERMKEFQRNTFMSLEEGRLSAIEAIALKPA